MPKMLKSEFSQEQWNKKRLVLAVLITLFLVIAGLGLKSYLLGSESPQSSNVNKNIKGTNTSTVPAVTLPTAEDIVQGVGGSIFNIKKEIEKINVVDLATSSPQIQKILNDIKALPSVPGQKAKDVCLNLCNGL